jgi:predicted DNA-binding transcriptional regulator YafY
MADLQRQGPVVQAHLMYPSDRRSAIELTALTTTLHDALQSGCRLHLQYQAGNAVQTTRVVQPLNLHYERGHSYLRAFCHLRQEERNFRLDRIVAVQLLTAE